MASAAGTLAINLSQMMEMKITKRKPSEAPVEAAEKVLDVKPAIQEYKQKFSQENTLGIRNNLRNYKVFFLDEFKRYNSHQHSFCNNLFNF